MAKKVSGCSVGSGSSLSAVSRGRAGGATLLGFGGAAAWTGGGAVVDGEAPGGGSLPAIGGAAGIGMNGLTRPSVEAGGLAWFAVGAEEVAAAGADAGALAELAAGVEDVAAAGGDAGASAGALAELDGVEDVAAAGAGAGVCASAPETRRGSPTSAPMNEIRSIMRQNPKP